MEIFRSLFLSFVQAATEFLPVSSSGHLLFFKSLILYERLPIIFDIVAHTGSLAAILFYYHKRLINTFRSAYHELINREAKKNVRFLLYLMMTTAVTFIIYIAFKALIESRVESEAILPVTFLITTLILLSTRFFQRRAEAPVQKMPVWMPLLIGVFQALAIFPGISRSGATISPLVIAGADRKEAAYYSFFLAIPAILGALIFKLMNAEDTGFIRANWLPMLFSLLVSTACSFAFLSLLNRILRRKGFWLFSFYTMAMAVASFILFW